MGVPCALLLSWAAFWLGALQPQCMPSPSRQARAGGSPLTVTPCAQRPWSASGCQCAPWPAGSGATMRHGGRRWIHPKPRSHLHSRRQQRPVRHMMPLLLWQEPASCSWRSATMQRQAARRQTLGPAKPLLTWPQAPHPLRLQHAETRRWWCACWRACARCMPRASLRFRGMMCWHGSRASRSSRLTASRRPRR